MDNIAPLFLNPSVLLYLALVASTQVLYSWWQERQEKIISTRRRTRGLPKDILLNHTQQLADRRRQALTQSLLLLATVVIFPFVLLGINRLVGIATGEAIGTATAEQTGLTLTAIALIASTVFNSTSVFKAFLEGLAYKTLAALTVPFQVGDRIAIDNISGKVVQLDTFFVTLETLRQERISIPTYRLWSETVTSINGGDRDSLCEMVFYLSPQVSAAQRQAAEDVIWNAIQSSAYLEPSKPIQIYLSQTDSAIQLTARAYVASTYNEPLFSSDVTRAFLDFSHEKQIPLASNK